MSFGHSPDLQGIQPLGPRREEKSREAAIEETRKRLGHAAACGDMGLGMYGSIFGISAISG